MCVRVATGADIPAMHRVRMSVHENVLQDPTSVTPEHTREILARHGRGWVAEANGGVVGFGIANRTTRSIWALFVEPGAEGRGLGRRLHDLMLDWLFESPAPSVWLTTDPDTRAERFYRRAGWEYIGSASNGEARYEMRRDHWLDHRNSEA